MKILTPVIASLLVTFSVAAESETFSVPTELTCDKDGTIIKKLAEEYKERPFAFGKASKDLRMVLMVNEKAKTWTVLAVMGNITCLMASGTDLTLLAQPAKYYISE
jgi:hypothetical protein